ncbi:MAG: nicotinate (nicotinamide) nucleotide adenylyltransferase [Deltaproteobacteria bacterium]|nr:nicotinate (nicotinamide) nucleotide adenylyltransferase [Deltaproteobacteria bacterium]MBW2595694.1 nicotinate (nicotinamide) nucleotide adenylyltransferase [Deltaproteobacteria bacterium]MBW2651160.1 nicotinate (nicotinamide) nucleotide adenylyltransferase [Deltaproteobacteria bacterium]
MKWGLFGGTFDPVHLGHLRCAEELLELFRLDRIIFIPARVQPLKAGRDIPPFHHRERMLRLAIEGNPSFSISDIENRRGGKSYSIETVRHFLDNSPDGTEFYFMLGQDAFHEIPMWKEWKDLVRLCNFVVMTRPGYETKKLTDTFPPDFASLFQYDSAADGFRGPAGCSIFFRGLTLLDISSTDIRNRVKANLSIRHLVPDPVRDYILKNSDSDYFLV